jgi:hypothetical protein
MSRGFVYIINSLDEHYEQQHFCNVPTFSNNRLYFGPCKIPIRKKMQPSDYVFGISPARLSPRRIVYLAQIDRRITFADAYREFPELRGPKGPIHVEPVDSVDNDKAFPESHYRHIECVMHGRIKYAMHRNSWKADLRSEDLDAFFVCKEPDGILGTWLGKSGPEITEGILEMLQNCSVHGKVGELSSHNKSATVKLPVRFNNLFTGLHLETREAEDLVNLCKRLSPLGGTLTENGTPETKCKQTNTSKKYRSC